MENVLHVYVYAQNLFLNMLAEQHKLILPAFIFCIWIKTIKWHDMY